MWLIWQELAPASKCRGIENCTEAGVKQPSIVVHKYYNIKNFLLREIYFVFIWLLACMCVQKLEDMILAGAGKEVLF